jgi:hypothetical protein
MTLKITYQYFSVFSVFSGPELYGFYPNPKPRVIRLHIAAEVWEST